MTSVSLLLVEDNPITRRMLKRALAEEGYAVVEAASAQAALAAAKALLPDLVLQDLLLPDMDGFALARRLRALPGATDLPILALSGCAGPYDKDRPPEFNDYLSEPMEPSFVLEAIEAHLARPRTAAGVERRRRVLVVDDEKPRLRWMQVQFARLGLEVSAASSAGEALVLASQTLPDVLVSTVRIQGRDGFRLCQRLRQDDRLRDIRIVLTSSKDVDGSEAELARQLGADAFALQSSELTEVVRALVEASQGPSSAPPALAPDDVITDRGGPLPRPIHGEASLRTGVVRTQAVLGRVNELLRRVDEMCSRPLDIEKTLTDLLSTYLEACGLGLGIAFTQHAGLKVDRPGRATDRVRRHGDPSRRLLAPVSRRRRRLSRWHSRQR